MPSYTFVIILRGTPRYLQRHRCRCPVAVPGVSIACQVRLASCRPLPLALLASSATGGARIAPRDRTGTMFPPRDFKSLASACSATAAFNSVIIRRTSDFVKPFARNLTPCTSGKAGYCAEKHNCKKSMNDMNVKKTKWPQIPEICYNIIDYKPPSGTES